MCGFVRDLLERGDMPGDATFSSEEIDGLSSEALSVFVGAGAIRQPRTDSDQQWIIDHDGLAAWLGRSLGARCTTTALVPGRLWHVGLLLHCYKVRDLFLVRGLAWHNGRAVAMHERLLASSRPVVLAYSQMPPIDFWQHYRPSVGSLRELGYLHGNKLLVESNILFCLPRVPTPNRPISCQTPVPHIPRDEVVLTQPEWDILKAMNKEPKTPHQLGALMAAGGYSKATTRKCLERFRELGLISQPPGTKRSGYAITTKGIALLNEAGPA